jgi:maltose O-acetyltransferase
MSRFSAQAKAFVATAAQYAFNRAITHVPSRTLRRAVLRCYLARLGQGCSIQMGVRFLHAPKVSLGDRVVVNYDCLIDGRRYPVTVGDDVSIGPAAAIITLGHEPQSPDFADRGGPVVIGRHAWIAYRAIVLPGVTVGEGAVVAAGAVVARDVPPFTIVAGVPARPVGERCRNLTYRLSYDPWLS